jgi:uncharacterized protein YndB with AHSA1/START domain
VAGELEMTRVLPAARPQVFAAFASADRLAEWWGPRGFTVPSVDFEAREGAEYRIEMRPPEGEPFLLRGEVTEAEPPRRLSFTFIWDPPDADDVETRADLSFEERDGSTEVSLRQGAFKTAERLALHREGWGESFDKLERLLAAE